MKTVQKNEGGGNSGDPLETFVAWFTYMKSKTPAKRRLSRVLDGIQSGVWRADVDRLRVILAERGKAAYNRKKEKLPSFYLSGTASAPATMLTHSGMVQVDLDGLGEQFAAIRAEVEPDPHAAAVFTSPSGGGLKIAFRLDPFDDPLDKDEHKRAFAAVSAYFVQRYGVTPDPQCKNVNRHCLVSYDPDLFRNPAAIPFDWRNNAPAAGEEEGESSSSKTPLLQDCNPTRLQDYPTTPHGQPDAETAASTNALAALKFQRGIEQSAPGLWTQYLRLVERRHEARGGERNATIIRAVPFLYRALSTPTVRLYMEWFYRVNAHIFKDPLESHLGQVDAMLKSVEVTYAAALSSVEREFWGAFDERGRATFRIARDLALFTGPSAPAPPEFFLSGESLAARHGWFRTDGRPQDEAGARSLRMLVQFHVIGVVAPGRKRIADAKGVPTLYRWLLV